MRPVLPPLRLPEDALHELQDIVAQHVTPEALAQANAVLDLLYRELNNYEDVPDRAYDSLIDVNNLLQMLRPGR